MIRDIELQCRLYAPSVATLRENLSAMGESLSAGCNALAADCTIDRVDQLTMRLKAGEQTLQHLRRALVAETGGVQSGGTG